MGQHWYTVDRKPMHTIVGQNGKERDTNLKDAKKLNLLPSVTSILDVVGSKSLEDYKLRQALFYARMCPGGMSERDQIKFVREAMDGDLSATAEQGSELHNDFESWAFGKPSVDGKTWSELSHKLQIKEFLANEVALGDISLGYGGTCDMVFIDTNNDIVIADLKTKKEPTHNGFFSSDSHPLQLGAYYNLLVKDERFSQFFKGRNVKGAIAFVSRMGRNGGVRTNDVRYYSNIEIQKSSMAFNNLVSFWQHQNNYVPGL